MAYKLSSLLCLAVYLIGVFQQVSGTDIAAACPSGFHAVGGSCYQINHGSMTWEEAKNNCLLKNANLATIPNRIEHDALFKTLDGDKQYWIGLSDQAAESRYVWASGKSYTFYNWQTGEPNDFRGSEDCVHIWAGKQGRWNDQSCGTKFNWICSRLKRAVILPSCPSGFFSVGRSCYQINHGTMSWDGAKNNCLQKNTHLAVIPNKIDQDALFAKLDGNKHYWIGLSDQAAEGRYAWENGKSYTFYNWQAGEPNNLLGVEDCVHIWAGKQGRWNDESCSSKFNWICSRPNGGFQLRGPPGPKGDRGLAGVGLRGSSGQKGERGLIGIPATKGTQGVAGQKGELGRVGTQGVPGPKGDMGHAAVGLAGLPGSKGSIGPIGNQGLPGGEGPKGDRGQLGQGVKGDQGDGGPAGLNGTKGGEGPPGAKGSRGSEGPRGVGAVIFTRHSQETKIPDCPPGTSSVYSGVSYVYSGRTAAGNTQDLGEAGSCMSLFDPVPLATCKTLAECNHENIYTSWLTTTDNIDRVDLLSKEQALQFVSRCSVCLSKQPVLTMHSQSEAVPICPVEWIALWEGFSYAGMTAEGGHSLSSVGSCLEKHMAIPYIDCHPSGKCVTTSHHEKPVWLRSVEEAEGKSAISRCTVCTILEN